MAWELTRLPYIPETCLQFPSCFQTSENRIPSMCSRWSWHSDSEKEAGLGGGRECDVMLKLLFKAEERSGARLLLEPRLMPGVSAQRGTRPEKTGVISPDWEVRSRNAAASMCYEQLQGKCRQEEDGTGMASRNSVNWVALWDGRLLSFLPLVSLNSHLQLPCFFFFFFFWFSGFRIYLNICKYKYINYM